MQVVTLDNFLSEEECDEMIRQGYSEGYERSSDVGKIKFDGEFRKSRQNTTLYCINRL